jgi:hypothetical protein
MIRFYFVISGGCEADAIEHPLFDVFVTGDFVPALETFFCVFRLPVELEDAFLITVD